MYPVVHVRNVDANANSSGWRCGSRVSGGSIHEDAWRRSIGHHGPVVHHGSRRLHCRGVRPHCHLRHHGHTVPPSIHSEHSPHSTIPSQQLDEDMWHYKCGPMPNVMAALPNIGSALCSTPQFGWRPLLECRAVTLPRRETRWNYLGCPKLTKRSQPLVGRSSPYCGDVYRGDIAA